MIYFSEIKGAKIYTEDNVYTGRLADLIFVAEETPIITKLVLTNTKGERLIIPISHVRKIDGSIVIDKNFQTQEMAENELFVGKNLLDKQIIDIKGSKIVRVNDVAINEKVGYYIAGVDIGLLGVLRWLGLEDFVMKQASRVRVKLSPRFLSWADIQPVELAQGKVVMKEEQDKLSKIPPEDLADHLEKINIRNVDRLLKSVDVEYAAEVIENLNVNYQTALFNHFSPEKAAQVLSLIHPDEAVDILLTTHEKKRTAIIELLPAKKKQEIAHLIALAKTPIGERLTTEYITAPPDATVREVVQKVRRETSDFSAHFYVYVVNRENILVGVVSLHELIMQKQDAPLYRFMKSDVVVIHLTTPEEIAAKKMFKYRLSALPVIDSARSILGIVTFDDVAESVLEKL